MTTHVIKVGDKTKYCVVCHHTITRDELGQHERWCIDNIGLNGWFRNGREFQFDERHMAFIFAIRAL